MHILELFICCRDISWRKHYALHEIHAVGRATPVQISMLHEVVVCSRFVISPAFILAARRLSPDSQSIARLATVVSSTATPLLQFRANHARRRTALVTISALS